MRRRGASAGRGGLVEAALMALRFAEFEASESAGQVTWWRQAADKAVAALTDDEARWVFDFHTGRITELGCLIEVIERNFGRYDHEVGLYDRVDY